MIRIGIVHNGAYTFNGKKIFIPASTIIKWLSSLIAHNNIQLSIFLMKPFIRKVSLVASLGNGAGRFGELVPK